VPSAPPRRARSQGKPWHAGILLQQVQRAAGGWHTPLLVTVSVGHRPGNPHPASAWDVSPWNGLCHQLLVACWGGSHHPGHVTSGWAPPPRTECLGVGSTTWVVSPQAGSEPRTQHPWVSSSSAHPGLPTPTIPDKCPSR